MQTLNKIPLWLLLALIPLLYVSTLADTLVLGDPSEFTFVASTLSIAHPPGYAFITLLGKLFQTLIPFGEIPWRMHLLSAVAATAGALFVYGTVRSVGRNTGEAGEFRDVSVELSAIFAALTVATAANYWQHAIHANPHIITAAFLAANLFFLTRWWASNREATAVEKTQNRWLYLFCFSAGLGVTHHPLTVFAFPAYALFIVVVRPSIWREWRTILVMVLLALLGLSLWLYFPIRSAMGPPFGPSTMNTLDGFLDHVLGRGITEALPYYPLAEQPDRALVFLSILRLQYAMTVAFLALIAFFFPILEWWMRRRGHRLAPLSTPGPLLLLYGLALAGNYLFVISLRAQDIMAYLLGTLLIVGLLAGLGLHSLLLYSRRRLHLSSSAVLLLVAALYLIGPVIQMVRNTSLVSLRNYDEGRAYVDAVFSHFADQNEGAVLLNDWEHMTPLWYTQLVEERWPDADDVRPEYVSTARSWLDNVFDYLPGGPVYLSNYRREIVDAGFRLQPSGPFFRVVEPGEQDLPPELTAAENQGGEVILAGYYLPERAVRAGDYVPLTLALSAPQGTEDFYVPVVHVGDLSFPFTTDSHVVSPDWEAAEIIVERFDLPLPHGMAGGSYPVSVRMKNLSTDEQSEEELSLGNINISEVANPPDTASLLANFRQRVGLLAAQASGDGQRARAPWQDPLIAEAGDTIHIILDWQSVDYAEESYTVFVHLIDQANRPLVALDYTPLGGATPTHLWIPKWLPGQRLQDPYRLRIPPDLAPGTYLIEVGLYEMVSGRRLHISDDAGNLTGDRLILGPISVQQGVR